MVVGEVHHHLAVLEGPRPVLALSHVALDDLDPGGQRRRLAVDHGREVVEDAHLVSLLQQQEGGTLADEAGPARDEHLHSTGL